MHSTPQKSPQHALTNFVVKAFSRGRNYIRENILIWKGNEYVRTYYGVYMKSNWDDKTFRMCVRGSYGVFLSDALRNIGDPFIFLDIGANQGIYSLIAAENQHCIAVIAFEPVKITGDLLYMNAIKNGFQNRIKIIRSALSNKSGKTQIKIERGHSGLASLRSEFGGDGTVEEVNLINMEEVDKHIPDHGDIFIKVDVEGHESVVLDQISRSKHAARVRFVFYEVDEAWQNPAALEDILRGVGFRSFKRVGERPHYDVIASR